MKRLLASALLLLALFPLLGATPANRGMTPTSGISFGPGGQFSIGAEAFFQQRSPDAKTFNQALLVIETEPGRVLEFFGGSAALRPPDPELKGNLFGFKLKYWKTDGLFRVHLTDTPEPSPHPVVNLILKSSIEPQNVAVAPFQAVTRRLIVIEFQHAGSKGGANMELQLSGRIQ